MSFIYKRQLAGLLGALTAGLAGIFCSQAAAAADLKTIVLLETMPVPVVLDHSRWFIKQLNELGYKEGHNMRLVTLQANGDRARAKHLLKTAIKKDPVDIVVTNATMASQVAAKTLAGTGIPILFMTVSDPVGAGLIKQVGVPTNGNLTGRVHMINRDTRINMAMRLASSPGVGERPVRIGFIHSSYPSSVGDIRQLLSAVESRADILFVPYKISYRKVPAGLPAMFAETRSAVEALKGKVDYWWEPSGPLGETDAYTRVLLKHSDKPIIMGTKLESVKIGALLHLTPSAEGTGREVARLAHAILDGADPGKIPPLPPAHFDVGINLGSALKANIVIPPELLKLAGKQVYR